MADKHAKLTLTVKRYNRDGTLISRVPFDSITLTPEFIYHDFVTASSSGTTVESVNMGLGKLDYLLVLNHSFVEVTVTLTPDTSSIQTSFTVPAASDSESPGLLLIQDVTVLDAAITLTAASGNADCEVFMFAPSEAA